MRLVLVGPTPPHRGGIPRHTAHLCRALARRHSVRLISYSRQYPRWLYPGRSDVDPSGAAASVPAERTLDQTWPPSWFATARSIVRDAPDAVVLQWWQSFGAPCTGTLVSVVRRTARVPVVAICHNFVAHEERTLDNLAARIGLGGISGLLVQSDVDLSRARRLLPGKPVWRVNHPVWDDLDGLRVAKTEARAALGIEGPTILFFGLVRPYKGLADLLAAMPEVLRRIKANLLVVGEFWEKREDYDRLIRSLDLQRHVRIVDRFVSDSEMAIYFGASDVVVLPYRSATQSGVVVSAYAFERPVIATRVGGLADMVDDGSSGRLVEPGDRQGLVEAIASFLTGGAPDAYAAGIAAVRQRLSWEGLVACIERAISETGGSRG